MSEQRQTLSVKQLDAMMPEGEMVHTFMCTGFMLIGADWKRSKILKAAKKRAELSGQQATSMGHGAVVWNEEGVPVFIDTTREP